MKRTSSRPVRSHRLTLECLERRELLSTTPLPSASLSAFEETSLRWENVQVQAHPRRWIVGIDGLSGSKSERLAAADDLIRGRTGGPAVEVQRHLGGEAFLLATKDAAAHADLEASLSRISGFRYVEPDLVYRTTAIPNDSYFHYLDGMNNTGQFSGVFDADIDAPEAWNYTTGSHSVVVGVIDTGVDYTHPDLGPNIWINPGEVASNGYDDDGNGYVDDVFGYDFANDDSDPFDDNGHGTHVAGTIGASGNNALGVVGVNWNVSIMALKFLEASGAGYTSSAVEAIYYATMMRQWGNNVRLTNNSWGGVGYSQSLRNAIVASADADMLFVAAAGNESSNNDKHGHYPSSYNIANIISVAATDNQNQLAGFSNYGAKNVDIAAPGVEILSTMPSAEYDFLSGTSMATPHVAGVAALGWSLIPTASFADIRNALLDGVDPVNSLALYTATGGGLNAVRTLQLLVTQPAYDGAGFVLGGAPGRVQIRQLWTGAFVTDFAPFGNAYTGGVTVAMGDLNLDGYREIVVGAASGNPHVKIFDGWSIAHNFNPPNVDSALLAQVFPFGLGFNVGANVAVGDVNGDGVPDVIAGATAGNPHVKVYSGIGMTLLKEFFAYGLQFNVGANVASADFNNDGYAEVVTGASAGNPHVKVYDGRTLIYGTVNSALRSQFFAYGLQFNVGAHVAAGDTNGDGVADLIVGATSGSPHVRVYDGRSVAAGSVPMTNNDWALLTQFFAYAAAPNLGVRVGAVDYNSDGRKEILTGASKTWPHFRVIAGNAVGFQPPALFEEFSNTISSGVFVGA